MAIIPNTTNTMRSLSDFLTRLLLSLFLINKYKILVETIYNNTEKILLDTQWCPEKFLSQSFRGINNSAKIVIITINKIVIIDAYADERINFNLFIILTNYSPPRCGRNYKSHCAN